MKPKKRRTDEIKSADLPYVRERIACRINALIDVMSLPVDKLRQVNTAAISKKLLELSDGSTACVTEAGQYFQLSFIIGAICDDDQTLEKVMSLGEQKFEWFKKTLEL
jgi:hypothetical protein